MHTGITGTTHTHSLEDLNGLSNRTPHCTHNNYITFNNIITTTRNYITNCFTKQFRNTLRHETTSKGAKPTQHTETTHPYTVSLKGDIHSPTLLNMYTADLTPPRAPVQVISYAVDITITATYTITSAAKTYIQPYLNEVFCLNKT